MAGKENKLKNINVRVTQDYVDKLEYISDTFGKSKSEVVRNMIDSVLIIMEGGKEKCVDKK